MLRTITSRALELQLASEELAPMRRFRQQKLRKKTNWDLISDSTVNKQLRAMMYQKSTIETTKKHSNVLLRTIASRALELQLASEEDAPMRRFRQQKLRKKTDVMLRTITSRGLELQLTSI